MNIQEALQKLIEARKSLNAAQDKYLSLNLIGIEAPTAAQVAALKAAKITRDMANEANDEAHEECMTALRALPQGEERKAWAIKAS
jgi:hypothetical protein